jgi:hypothetical protein
MSYSVEKPLVIHLELNIDFEEFGIHSEMNAWCEDFVAHDGNWEIEDFSGPNKGRQIGDSPW